MKLAYYKATHSEDLKARQAGLEQYEQIMADRLEDDLIFGNIVNQTCRLQDSSCIDKISAPIATLQGDSHLECHKRLTSMVFDKCPRRRRIIGLQVAGMHTT